MSDVRRLKKQGWTEVTVPRKNLYGWNQINWDKDIGNDVFVKEVVEWCQERFDTKDYYYSMPPRGFWVGQYGNQPNRFVFRRSEDAMLFKLRWAE